MTDKPVPVLSGHEWWTYPRGWRDVIRCKLGRHRRVFTADLHDDVSPVHRCSCGALQLSGADDVWFPERGGAARRRKGEAVPAGDAEIAHWYDTHCSVTGELLDEPAHQGDAASGG